MVRLKCVGPIALGDEYLRGLRFPALLCFTLAFVEGFAKFAGLETEDLGLSLVGLALIAQLLPLQLELVRLDLEQFGLLPADLLLVYDLPFDRADLP